MIHYDGFAKEGFEIIAAFDIRPNRTKGDHLKIPVLPMDHLPSFISEHSVKLAILTVPGTGAQGVTNTLVEAGIQAILNFSTIILQVPNNVVVNNVNLAIELENLKLLHHVGRSTFSVRRLTFARSVSRYVMRPALPLLKSTKRIFPVPASVQRRRQVPPSGLDMRP